MKTLIFNGSPRKNGDTMFLVNELSKKLSGDVKIINSYYNDISPCVDCRFCWEKSFCRINDSMQEIYNYIYECDNIVIASPLYFSELSGSLLNLLSRLQMIWAARFFRNEILVEKEKKGALIICGGGDGNILKAEDTAKTILRHMNASHNYVGKVVSHNTNTLPSEDDENAVNGILELAILLNS